MVISLNVMPLAHGAWMHKVRAASAACGTGWAAAAAAALALALAPPALAADPPAAAAAPPSSSPPPHEAFFNRATLDQAALSPSGRWLAALAPAVGGRNSLVVLDLDGKEKPRVVARFSDIDIDRFWWVNDERLVYNVRDRDKAAGWQIHGGGLLGVMRDGTGQRSLIDTQWVSVLESTQIVSRILSPLHFLIAVPRGGGNEVIVGELRFTLNGEWAGIVAKRLDVDTGRAVSVSQGLPAEVDRIWFDADGLPRVVTSNRAGRAKVWWRGSNQTAWSQLADFDAAKVDWWPAFVTSDGEFYVERPAGAAGEDELVRYDFSKNQPAADALVRTPGFDFSGALVAESPGARSLGVRTTTDAESTVWFDPQLKKLQDEIDGRLPGRVNRIDCKRCGTPEMTALVFSYSDREPGEYWLWRQSAVLGGSNWQQVARTRAAINPRTMGQLDLHRIKARDGSDLPVWVTQPAGAKTGDKRPAVVLVHGGPWVRGRAWGWDPTSQFLASRGYVVIEPEFRGSAGYGTSHYRAGFKQWGRAMQDDVADATLWAAKNAGVDADRICIAGASYGGYSTLIGLVRHPDLYKCGVAWVAVTEPRLLFNWATGGDLGEDWRTYGLPVRLGDPVADAAMLQSVSPAVQAARIQAPLLLAFGSEDRRVPLQHGTLMRDALKAAGRPPTFVVYDGEGHYWQKTDTQIDFAKRMEKFLAQHLR